MRHEHTSESTHQANEASGATPLTVHPSVLSILYYLDELEAQVPEPENKPQESIPECFE